MSFSGDQGLQLNDPQSNRGLVNMFNLEIPFGLFLGSSMVFLVLDSLKARSEAELRNRYLWSGIINILLPLIPIIILILALGPFVSAQVESIMGGSAPGPVRDMIDSVSSNPVGGQYTGTISEIGEARLEWGLGKGCYMIILAGLIKIGGSFLCSGKEGRG